MSIGGHQSAKADTVEWLTPPEIVRALGPFDLDPCSPINRPWDTAKAHYCRGGLQKPWVGTVWLNPPYGREIGAWLERLADHGDGLALIFARTETKAFWNFVWLRASAMFFFSGRLHFYRIDGTRAKANAGAPSVIVAYGDKCRQRLMDRKSRLQNGSFVSRWEI